MEDLSYNAYDDYFKMVKVMNIEELTFEESLRELREKRENLKQDEKDFKEKWKHEIRLKKLNNIYGK